MAVTALILPTWPPGARPPYYAHGGSECDTSKNSSAASIACAGPMTRSLWPSFPKCDRFSSPQTVLQVDNAAANLHATLRPRIKSRGDNCTSELLTCSWRPGGQWRGSETGRVSLAPISTLVVAELRSLLAGANSLRVANGSLTIACPRTETGQFVENYNCRSKSRGRSQLACNPVQIFSGSMKGRQCERAPDVFTETSGQ